MINLNNNNNQLIRNKPKIPYTRHLVEDDKNHEVSIFRVHHFQSRITLTLLYYLMFVHTTQLLGKILDTVGAPGCLEYAGAKNNKSDASVPVGWTLLYQLLNDPNNGVLRGYSNRIILGQKVVTKQKDKIREIPELCSKRAEDLRTAGSPVPVVIEKGASYYLVYELLKQDTATARTEKRKLKETDKAAMESAETIWGLQGPANTDTLFSTSTLTRRRQIVSPNEGDTAVATGTVAPELTGKSNNNAIIVEGMVINPLKKFQAQQDASFPDSEVVKTQFNFIKMIQSNITSLTAGHTQVQGGTGGVNNQYEAKVRSLKTRIDGLRDLERDTDCVTMKEACRSKRRPLEAKYLDLLAEPDDDSNI
jgi:hypothetical protein